MTGTLGDLKQRIIDETNRDDLQDDLASALNRVIADAIEFYAPERWWWTEARDTSTTTAGNEYLNRSAGARLVDKPFLVVGNVRYRLTKRSREWIEGMYSTPQTGQPTDYAEIGAQLRLWPTPNTNYSVIWLDIDDAAALDYADDASANAWTTNCPQLIAARARMILFRDYFRDDLAYARADTAEKQWYAHFKGETNRRLGTGRIRPSAL